MRELKIVLLFWTCELWHWWFMVREDALLSDRLSHHVKSLIVPSVWEYEMLTAYGNWFLR